MNSLYQDHTVTLAKQEDRLYLIYQERSYPLSSNPYEPCFYIGLSDEKQITIHNSFETREIEKAAKSNGSIRMITGHAYNIKEICRLLVLAIELEQESIDISYLEGRRFIRILENLHAYSPETAADLSVYGLKNLNIMEGFIHAKRIAATKDGWYYITKPYNGRSD